MVESPRSEQFSEAHRNPTAAATQDRGESRPPRRNETSKFDCALS